MYDNRRVTVDSKISTVRYLKLSFLRRSISISELHDFPRVGSHLSVPLQY